MNKNTIIGLLIILMGVQFFTSRFYYEKVLHKPLPVKKSELQKKDISNIDETVVSNIKDIDTLNKNNDTELSSLSSLKKESLDTLTLKKIVDTLKVTEPVIPNDTITIENSKLIIRISELGAKIISIKTKDYKYTIKEKSDKLVELVDNSEIGGANLTINSINYDNRHFKFIGIKTTDNGKKYTFISSDSVVKEFIVNNNSYVIDFNITYKDLKGYNVNTGWLGGISESEARGDAKGMQYNRKKIHYHQGKESEHYEISKVRKIEDTGYFDWVALSSKYFTISFIQRDSREVSIIFDTKIKGNIGKVKLFHTDMIITSMADRDTLNYSIYAGPTQVSELKEVNDDLSVILFGVSTGVGKFFAKIFIGGNIWFPKICEFILSIMIKLKYLVKDFGLVIIILTIMLRVVTYPLTQSSMKSMNKMKVIQPKINKIREKYKSNPKKMNEKMMAFYKEEGVNPLAGAGGCLPMILQMPIMISLYVVLRKAIELRGEHTFLIPWVSDLSQAEVLFKLPFTLPLYGNSFALFPVIFAFLMYLQQKDQIKDPNQKAMIYMMPIMMLVMFNNFPAGLNLYFTLSTGFQFVQQKYLTKK